MQLFEACVLFRAREKELGSDALETLEAMADVAALRTKRGEWAEARKIEEQILTTLRGRTPPPPEDDPQILAVLFRLWRILTAMGDHAGAEEIRREMLPEGQTGSESSPEELLTGLLDRVSDPDGGGQLTAFKELQETLVRIYLGSRGCDDLTTLEALAELAVTLHKLGDHNAAHEIQKYVLAAYRKISEGEISGALAAAMSAFARTLVAQGELDQARSLVEEVADAQRRLFGPSHPKTLETLSALADILIAQAFFREALVIRRQIVTTKRESLGEEDPKTLTAMGKLAKALVAAGLLTEAEEMHELVYETRLKTLGASNPETLSSRQKLAETLRDQGKLDEALPHYEDIVNQDLKNLEARKDLREIYLANDNPEMASRMEEEIVNLLKEKIEKLTAKEGATDPETLKVKVELANLHRMRGELEEEEELRDQINEALLGPEDADRPIRSDALAEVIGQVEDLEEARRRAADAINEARQSMGEENPRTLGLMTGFANLFQELGDLDGARELQETVLEIQRRILDAGDPELLRSIESLAVILIAQGHLPEARHLYEQVLDVRRHNLGASDPETLRIMEELASVLESEGDLTAALEVYEGAMEGWRDTLGPESSNTLRSMSRLASVHQARGDLEEARQLFERVLEVRTHLFGTEHPKTLTSMADLLTVLDLLGDLDGVTRLRGELVGATEALLDPKSPQDLQRMSELAKFFEEQGALGRARVMLEALVEASIRYQGEDHRETLNLMMQLARIMKSRGDLTQARQLQEEVLDKQRWLLDPFDPGILRSMEVLAAITLEQGDLSSAQLLQEEVLTIQQSLLPDPEHTEILRLKNDLALTMRARGDWSGAQRLLEEILEVYEGRHSLEALRAMEDLASTLRLLGKLEPALELGKMVLAMCRQRKGLRHPDTLRAKILLAVTLRAQGKLREARKLLEQVSRALQGSPDSDDPEYLTLKSELAATLQAQGEFADAQVLREEVYSKRLRLLGPEHSATFDSLNDLALIREARGDLVGALGLHKRALAAKRQHLGPEHPATLEAMQALAATQRKLGDLTDAERLQSQVLATRRRLLKGHHPETLRAMNELAITLRSRGEQAESRGLLEETLELSRRELGTKHQLTINSTINLGFTLTEQFDWDRAMQLLEDSLSQTRWIPNVEASKYFTFMGGILPPHVEDWDDAVKTFEQLWSNQLHTLGRYHPDTMASYHNLAVALGQSGDLSGSLKLLEEVLDAQTQRLGEEHPATLITMYNLAYVHVQLSGLDKAMYLAQKALAITERHLTPTHPNISRISLLLANIAQLQDDLDGAEILFHRALEVQQQKAKGTFEEVAIRQGLGNLYLRSGQLEQAEQSFLEGITALEKQIDRVSFSSEKKSWFRSVHEKIYRQAIECQIARGRLGSALHTLERFRARGFLEKLTTRDLIFAELPVELDRRLRRAKVRYDAITRWRAASGSKDSLKEDELRVELKQLRQERQDIYTKIRSTSEKLAQLLDPQPLTAEEIQATLDPGTLLLSFSVGENRTYIFAVTHEGNLEVEIQPIGRQNLESQVQTFVDALLEEKRSRHLEGVLHSGQRLCKTLLEPVEHLLERSKRLLIIPDGPLYRLPFAALVCPTWRNEPRYLIERFPLHFALSATVYAELRHAGESNNQTDEPVTGLRLFGDPVYPESFELERLDNSGWEVQEIAAQVPPDGSEVYLKGEATEERVKEVAPTGRIIHFAVHSILDEFVPLDSFLALSIPEVAEGNADNGLLQAWEIFEQLRLGAEMVVLSACQTALGDELRGEGIIGLTRAFQYAGARSVVSSLWRVDDEATAELMVRFYRQLQAGSAKDEALREAQLAFIGDPEKISAPYYWAAFQIAGDWQ